jgi:electron transfer flavoprotein beta subunit
MTVEEEIRLPAVIGMQTARQTPRYAPITRVRQAMQAGGLEEVAAGVATAGLPPGMSVRRLFPPEKSGQAEMLTGDAEAVANRIVEILRERGLIKV